MARTQILVDTNVVIEPKAIVGYPLLLLRRFSAGEAGG